MTAPELKPCPFCGEKMPPHDDTAWVRCYGCGAETGWRPTGDEAAAAWNTRADLHDATKAQLAKAVEALTEIIARWDTPAWKDVEPTAAVINRSRAVLAEIEKGGV